MASMTKPSGIIGTDHGQRKHVCETFERSAEIYQNRARYFDEIFSPQHREEMFPDNESISFKAEVKRIKLLELIRADATIGNWLDQSTRDGMGKVPGSNRNNLSDVFFWIMCRMAVYRLGRGYGTPIKPIEPKHECTEDGNDTQATKRVKTNSESHA